jgi:hypothetical protein
VWNSWGMGKAGEIGMSYIGEMCEGDKFDVFNKTK